MSGAEGCPDCEGAGSVCVGQSWSFGRWHDDMRACRSCEGTGKAPAPPEDDDHYEAEREAYADEARAEAHHREERDRCERETGRPR